MAGTYRAVHVFISSTFCDMQAERDHLVKVTFPSLRERLEKHRVHLTDIDLRWGVTKEQAQNDRVLALCLRQIDECRPFFLGILGERYGWVPTQYSVEAISRFGWVQHHTGKSLTELEILHGALNNPAMEGHAFFYFRDLGALTNIPEGIRQDVYVETDPVQISKLADLKDRIRRSRYPVMDPYPAQWDPDAWDRPTRSHGRLGELTAFGKRVEEQLSDAIKAALSLPNGQPKATPLRAETDRPKAVVGRQMVAVLKKDFDQLAEEADSQERFMESRLRTYVGREQLRSDLMSFVTGRRPQVCVLTGPPGSGKSAALARLLSDFRSQHPEALTLVHFVAASEYSSSLNMMLERFCVILKKRFDPELRLPERTRELASAFAALLAKISADSPVLICLDDPDQLGQGTSGEHLTWLPRRLPQQVKVVLTSRDVDDTRRITLGNLGPEEHYAIAIGPLSDSDRRQLIETIPSMFAKTLDARQTAILLDNPATTNPLFLVVALEELRVFGSFEQLDKRIADLPSGGEALVSLYEQMLHRLDEDFGARKVHDVLTLQTAARRGLSESELRDMTRTWSEPDDLFAILRELRPHLMWRGMQLVLAHDSLCRAVCEMYLPDVEAAQTAHLRLADYFEKRSYFPQTLQELSSLGEAPEGVWHDPRKVEELPWQLAQAGEWNRLFDLLRDLDLLNVLYSRSNVDALAYWAKIEQNSDLRMFDAYRSVCEAPQQVNDIEKLWNVGCLLDDAGQGDKVTTLWEYSADEYRRRGDKARLAAALSNLGAGLYRHRNLSAALKCFSEAESLCRAIGNERMLHAALSNQASVRMELGDPAGALETYSEHERILRRSGNLEWLQQSLLQQARALNLLGRSEEAMPLLEEQERICREIGHQQGLSSSLLLQAATHSDRHDFPRAMKMAQETERICRTLGIKDDLQKSLGLQGHILFSQGDFSGAMAINDKRVVVCREIGDSDALQGVLNSQALILKDHGDLNGALSKFEETTRICRQAGNMEGLVKSLSNRATVLGQEMDRTAEAVALAKEALRLAEENSFSDLAEMIESNIRSFQGKSLEQRDALFNQARVQIEAGNVEGAISTWKRTASLCRDSGDDEGLEMALANQALYMTHELDRALEALPLAQEAWNLEQQHSTSHASEIETIFKCVCSKSQEARNNLFEEGTALAAKGDMDGALQIFRKHEKACRAAQDTHGVAISLNEQGLALAALGHPGKGQEMMTRQEAICRDSRHIEQLAICLCNQAFILLTYMNCPKHTLEVAEEAHALVVRHHLESLSGQVKELLDLVRLRLG